MEDRGLEEGEDLILERLEEEDLILVAQEMDLTLEGLEEEEDLILEGLADSTLEVRDSEVVRAKEADSTLVAQEMDLTLDWAAVDLTWEVQGST